MENRLLRLQKNKLLNLKVSHKKEYIHEWYKKYQTGDLKDEVRNYLNFERCILKKILNYKTSDYQFEYPLDGRSVEFMIMKDDEPYMAIELKGTNTKDLTKRTSGDKYSAVEQASNYANKKSSIKWFIVSNYYEFRLYHHDSQNRYISFTLDDLKPGGYDFDEKRIQQFLTVFSRESTLEKDYITKLYDTEGLFPEDFNLENEFYKLYNETRLMLIKELEENNQLNKDETIEHAQIILNRYIFICFCEDKDLLPDNLTTDEILTPIRRKVLAISTIWSRLNELFYFINNGNPDNNITGYNGGLFEEDLTHLRIRDKIENDKFYENINVKWSFPEQEHIIDHELRNYPTINQIYRNLLIISSFDFNTDLTENILGHIFENSISDLEKLKQDEKSSKRKKEGVYYTPEHITAYICENTIIPYLSTKNNNTVDSLIKEYTNNLDELEEKLHNIKILDPACGSGAFLNKATDTLLTIHESIFNLKHTDSENLDKEFDNIDNRREILLNNIYGVDLNHESIEITKLGLFLKVCKKGIKLPDLDKNIKCGNSLINDSDYTNRPFNWENEYPEIIANGGFDIVIGNPPYVFGGNKGITNIEKEFFKENYTSGKGKINLFVLFIEKGNNLVKKSGLLSYIVPNTLLRVTSYVKIREFLVQNTKINEIVDLSSGVFEGAVTSSIIIFLTNQKDNLEQEVIIKKDLSDKVFNKIKQNEFSHNGFIFNISCKPHELEIIKKIKKNSLDLGELIKYLRFGVVISKNKDNLIGFKKVDEKYKPFLEGKEIEKYGINYKGRYLLYQKDLIHRSRTPDLFESEKIMIQRITGGNNPIKATYDNKKFYNKESIINLVLNNNTLYYEYILSILNSNLINWFYIKEFTNGSELTVNLSKEYLSEIPIKEISCSNQEKFVKLVTKIIEKNKIINDEIKSFHEYLLSDFNVSKINKKLTEYYNFSFDDLYKEIKKQYKQITRKEKDKLEKEYLLSLEIIEPLQKEITNIDDEINSLVYELYGLTDEEIAIIENSF